jgi:hypothetical protein
MTVALFLSEDKFMSSRTITSKIVKNQSATVVHTSQLLLLRLLLYFFLQIFFKPFLRNKIDPMPLNSCTKLWLSVFCTYAKCIRQFRRRRHFCEKLIYWRWLVRFDEITKYLDTFHRRNTDWSWSLVKLYWSHSKHFLIVIDPLLSFSLVFFVKYLKYKYMYIPFSLNAYGIPMASFNCYSLRV